MVREMNVNTKKALAIFFSLMIFGIGAYLAYKDIEKIMGEKS